MKNTNLKCHVIAARRKEFSLRVPFDGINLICVTLERLDGPVLAERAHVDLLVSGARGETLLGLPVHVQGRGRVEAELLLTVTCCRIPDDCCPGRTIFLKLDQIESLI